MKRLLRGFWKLIFGRTTILAVLLLIQFAFLFGGFFAISEHFILVQYIMAILAIVVFIYVLNSQLESDFKLMWIVLLLATPVFGVMFYLFVKLQPGTRRIENELAGALNAQKPLRKQNKDVKDRLLAESPENYGIFNYLDKITNHPVYDKASVKYFPIGEDKFKALVSRLESAREFIFMEYFIIDKGYMWDTILEVLERKASEGVEVRLMYDGTNTLSLLPKNYPKVLSQKGIECRVFSPMIPFLATHQNNRDHRKIAVIDGKYAFTGGINLADEYINRKNRFGHWKDTAIMVQGEAVNSFTLMFLQMWDVGAAEFTDYGKYLRYGLLPELGMRNGGYITPYADSPLDNELTGEKVYLDILNKSVNYVHIMTPYLILDEEVINAMIYAVDRDVDVKLILPHVPDKKYAYALARTYYRQLVEAGVKIYEYTPGFVHAKVFTSDDSKAVVGTINMDFRSLYLHFECAAYIYDNPVIYDIEADFEETLAKCQEITLADCMEYSKIKLLAGSIIRLVAPLM